MKLQAISFKNYKAFVEEQKFEIKPITIIIGKNSSGKSAIAKLFTLLEGSLSGNISEPLRLSNNKVVLGNEFRDLLYNREPSLLTVKAHFQDDSTLEVDVANERGNSPLLAIYRWSYKGETYTRTSDSNIYTDEEGRKFLIFFNGFIPKSIKSVDGGEVGIPDMDVSLDVDYIGPFRLFPERTFSLTGEINFSKTGIKGENAYTILGTSKLIDSEIHKLVGKWYADHFDGWELDVVNAGPYIELRLKKNGSDVNIVDVGQGMSQALPLVVRSMLHKTGSIIVLEQPELHLHPAAHADMAELFALSSKAYKQSFIIETHSENILLRIRKLVVENHFDFSKEDVVVYWVTDSATQGQTLEKITIDEDGMLSNWPDGVFTENVHEITAIQEAISRKRSQE
jgi:predicted ATPase